MLQLRPICEHCALDLPPNSADAMICSYECTFCRGCVDGVLGNVCPNCEGGFESRPTRPVGEWRDGVTLANFPAVAECHHRSVDIDAHRPLRDRVGDLDPRAR
jgi:hypothetical protein